MAPRGSGRGRGRGRPRKRLSRMDAAIDAMTAFGFDEPLVHKTVKKLLKEYGGDDGWAFIEEYAYKELIDAILRHQDEHTKVESTAQFTSLLVFACLCLSCIISRVYSNLRSIKCIHSCWRKWFLESVKNT